MKKIACKRCKNLILVSTANKYNGYSNYCLKMHNQEQKQIKKVVPKEKTIVELAIESEQLLYNLEKQRTEEIALERIFTEKNDNRASVIHVLDQLCFTMLGQNLAEVLA